MLISLKLALFKRRQGAARIGRKVMGLNRQRSEKALLWLLEAMINIARMQLRDNKLPPLYKAGVVYVREKDTEIWKDPIETYLDGFGDCEDLSIWRIAELRNNGKWAEPYIRYRVVDGVFIYHVLVKRASDKFEDPSKILGMTGRD